MSPSDMVPALADRSIAGYVVADPFNAMAQIKKIGRIRTFLGDVWRDHACCALVTREDVIARHPESVQALTDGVVAAQRWIDANRPPRRPSWPAGVTCHNRCLRFNWR